MTTVDETFHADPFLRACNLIDAIHAGTLNAVVIYTVSEWRAGSPATVSHCLNIDAAIQLASRESAWPESQVMQEIIGTEGILSRIWVYYSFPIYRRGAMLGGGSTRVYKRRYP